MAYLNSNTAATMRTTITTATATPITIGKMESPLPPPPTPVCSPAVAESQDVIGGSRITARG